jgi:hypothetical protein
LTRLNWDNIEVICIDACIRVCRVKLGSHILVRYAINLLQEIVQGQTGLLVAGLRGLQRSLGARKV